MAAESSGEVRKHPLLLFPTPKRCDCEQYFSAIDTAEVPGKYVDFYYCKDTWQKAQEVCESKGGKLWEPQNSIEYEAGWTYIGYVFNC